MCFSGGSRGSAPAARPTPAPARAATPAAAAQATPSSFVGADGAVVGQQPAPSVTQSQNVRQSEQRRIASTASEPQAATATAKDTKQFFDATRGDGGGEFRGTSPFTEIPNGDKFYNRRGGGAEVPGVSVVVENQPNAPAVGGGAPGVGEQGFGRRALVGADATIVSAADPQSYVSNDASAPAAQAPSDVAADPNYVEPGPNTAYIVDQQYNMPISAQGIQGFIQNDPRVAAAPGGPISRNLSAARTGYGRRFN